MKMNMFRLAAFAVAFMMMLSLLTGCKSNKASKSDTAKKSTESKEITDSENSGEEVFDIKTDYCTLKYPEEYKDTVKTTVINTGVYAVCFTTTVNNNEVKIFDIVFGGEEGYKLGTLKDGKKSIDVYVKDYSADFPKDISEEDGNRLDVMAQKINVIISNLQKDYDFEIAG